MANGIIRFLPFSPGNQQRQCKFSPFSIGKTHQHHKLNVEFSPVKWLIPFDSQLLDLETQDFSTVFLKGGHIDCGILWDILGICGAVVSPTP